MMYHQPSGSLYLSTFLPLQACVCVCVYMWKQEGSPAPHPQPPTLALQAHAVPTSFCVGMRNLNSGPLVM